MEATKELSAWQLCDRVLRSVFLALWRLAALVLLTVVLYAMVSAYGQRILPFAPMDDWRQRFINELFYICLHAAILAPVAIGTMQLVLWGEARKQDFWSKSLLYVVGFLILREIVDLLLVVPVWISNHAAPFLFYDWMRDGWGRILLFLLYVAPVYLWYLVCFLIWVRLIFLWPKAVAAPEGWRVSIMEAWGDMRGKYGFALRAGLFATLPYLFFENFIYSHVYRRLIDVGAPVSPKPDLAQVEAMLVLGALLTLRYMLYASLAAWLYRVIAAGRPAVTAPSPLHTRPAHRPAL